MAGKARPFRLWDRGGVFYYRFPGLRGWRSTGCSKKGEAIEHVLSRLQEASPRIGRKRRTFPDKTTLAEYMKPFYTEDCPHVARLRSEGKSIGQAHIYAMRRLLEAKILPDPIACIPVLYLRRGDILDFRDRLREGGLGPRTVNRTMQVLKTAIQEGFFREELAHNPCVGIGQVKYQLRERGVFSEGEIHSMFSECPGPFEDRTSWTAFLVLYSLGLRRGELLALKWGAVDFEKGMVNITEAMKTDAGEIGKPKWEKLRFVPLPSATAEALKEYRKERELVLPHNFVFCYADGKPMLRTWIQGKFSKAMKRMRIEAKARSLSIHSFRHSLATHLVSTGYQSEKIRASMGWADARVMQGYLHLQPEHLQAQAGIVDGILK